MEAIIVFFEDMIRPFVEAWYAGGVIAVLSYILSLVGTTIALRVAWIIFKYIRKRKKAKKQAAAEEEAARIQVIEEIKTVVKKELIKHI